MRSAKWKILALICALGLLMPPTAGAQDPENTDDPVSEDLRPDDREDFWAGAYAGISVDTFAGSEFKEYVNPDASGDVQERGIFGFDFGYRLFDSFKPATTNPTDVPDTGAFDPFRQQLWIYGETLHGARSTELDCKAHPNIAVCQANFGPLGPDPLSDGLYLLRNATSLEAFGGLQYEFLGVNTGGKHPARLYVKGQAGMMTVAGNGGDVVDMHHVGIGLTTTGGTLSGSHLEVGFGRSDFFLERRSQRLKVDALLSKKLTDVVSFFGQITVDADAGGGADSIQSYFGFDIDLRVFDLF